MESACRYALNDYPLRENKDGLMLISLLLKAKSKNLKLYIKACILTVSWKEHFRCIIKKQLNLV